jgi:hypothetical protein
VIDFSLKVPKPNTTSNRSQIGNEPDGLEVDHAIACICHPLCQGRFLFCTKQSPYLPLGIALLLFTHIYVTLWVSTRLVCIPTNN